MSSFILSIYSWEWSLVDFLKSFPWHPSKGHQCPAIPIYNLSDKKSWDTSTQRCLFFFTSGPSPRLPNGVYRSQLANLVHRYWECKKTAKCPNTDFDRDCSSSIRITFSREELLTFVVWSKCFSRRQQVVVDQHSAQVIDSFKCSGL